MRDSFVFYRSFYEAIEELPEPMKVACLEMIIRYALDGELPSTNGAARAVFNAVKPQIDANNLRFENGKKGGRPKKKTYGSENEKPMVSKKADSEKPNVNDNVNVNVNVNVNEYEYIVSEFNTICGTYMPTVMKMTATRRTAIKARLKEYSAEDIVKVFRKAAASDFLSGRNGRWTKCSFDWIMKPSNFVKIAEGNYDDKKSSFYEREGIELI